MKLLLEEAMARQRAGLSMKDVEVTDSIDEARGNWGHAGRKGQWGGSAPSSGGAGGGAARAEEIVRDRKAAADRASSGGGGGSADDAEAAMYAAKNKMKSERGMADWTVDSVDLADNPDVKGLVSYGDAGVLTRDEGFVVEYRPNRVPSKKEFETELANSVERMEGVKKVRTYEDLGMLTRDRGFEVSLADNTTYQFTISDAQRLKYYVTVKEK